ncbi:Radical SAM superfamily enzyme, MoaA/NifB/PqqE/SkfB family [Roseateles sp. YR242]|uniref:radical SAM protein n=1 Tax=Roseateles sp. YR242 TaxID=1855305 RepID=UPI0008D3499D|nr:radical SAM protein [Roseateles sp. YR242]SEL52358.1 Radical SAM superfamily enzyme, MoaA/NifB/PqqE/SkfB family [Roseateles sp. YR242]
MKNFEPHLGRVIWDLTYACPLRCIHCYSESGRRKSEVLDEAVALRLARKLADAGPDRVSFGGGEPLMAKWWKGAADVFRNSGIRIAVFTGGWLLEPDLAVELVTSVDNVSISIDGPNAAVHDIIRGRNGSFERAMRAVALLLEAREKSGARCEIAVEYTATRTALAGLEEFLGSLIRRFPSLNYIRVGAVIPEGLAAEPKFCEVHLLREEEFDQLQRICESVARQHTDFSPRVEFTDVREFLPSAETPAEDAEGVILHLEPSGQVRAMTNYEAKVGDALTTPIAELTQRIWKWRLDEDIRERFRQVQSFSKWAEITRGIDLDHGSEADRIRILKRR